LRKPQGEPIAIRPIGDPLRQSNRGAGNALETKFEERPVADVEQSLGNVNLEIRIDTGATAPLKWGMAERDRFGPDAEARGVHA
jgi:hypothetical protein